MTKSSRKTTNKRTQGNPLPAPSEPVPDPSEMYPISVLAKKLPHGVGYAAITAWIATGRESVSGKLVKMRSWRMPFGRASTVQAYREFIDALNR